MLNKNLNGSSLGQDLERRRSDLGALASPQLIPRSGQLGSTDVLRTRLPIEPARPFSEQPVVRRRGLVDAFVRTCERWRLSDDQMALLLGYNPAEFFFERLVRGYVTQLPRDVKDRATYVIGISIGLGSVFGESVDAELSWLNRPHPKIENRTPLGHMLEGGMMNLIAVEELVAIERGL